jgi:4-carboxymuconolactone decarboxylase
LKPGAYRATLPALARRAGPPDRGGHALSDKRETGQSVRRAVLGDAHVDRAEAAQTEFDAPFQELITEAAWGTVWAGDGISRRERSMLTLALLAATGNFEEIPMHIRATARTGASRRDVIEAFQHVAVYAGVPRANHAIRLARQTYDEMAAEAET